MIKTPKNERLRAIKSVQRCVIDLEEEDKRRLVFQLFGMISVRQPEMLLEAAEATGLIEKLRGMDKRDLEMIEVEKRMAIRAKGENS